MDAQLVAILFTIVGVGIALATQIATQTRGLRGEIGKVSERVDHLGERVGGLSERVAHIEGLIAGRFGQQRQAEDSPPQA